MPTLEFKGKQHIYAHHLTVPHRPLIVDPAKSFPQQQNRGGGGGTPVLSSALPDDNLIIHGDNLHALKALLPRYAGKVNCIYIDPPYNTGNEGWVYNDNVKAPLLSDWYADESPVDGEDLERHDKWLCMMWPRLQLLRELLADDGIIFISIDDNEQHHLRSIVDEIFGESCFLADIIWQHRHGRSNNARLFSNQREHVLVYRRSESLTKIRIARSTELDESYSNPDDDPRGPWTSSSYVNPATKEARPNLVYDIQNPITGSIVRHPSHAWKYSRETHEQHIATDRLYWGAHGEHQYPRLKNYLSESREKGIVPIDLLTADVGGTTEEGTRRVNRLFADEGTTFNNPKPVNLIRKMIQIAEGAGHKTPIILDSFAGSGTTADAVLSLNHEDSGHRRFILIELEGYADTITAERVRHVIKGVPAAKDPQLRDGLGGSFTYCTLGEPLDPEAMLGGVSLPPYAELAAYLLYTATGISLDGAELKPRDDGRFFGDEDTDYYLFYEPDLEWLQSNDAVFTERQAKQIRATEPGRSAVVFAAGKYIGQRELSRMNITFCQLPYELHRVGG